MITNYIWEISAKGHITIRLIKVFHYYYAFLCSNVQNLDTQKRFAIIDSDDHIKVNTVNP